jgi:hypothetical protein
MHDYELEHLFTYKGILADQPEVIGPVAEGLRVNFYNVGGEATGPRVKGKLRPVGGDWLTLRTDGVALLNVRATIETHDGALILVTYEGMGDLGEGGYEAFQRGELPPVVKLRIAPRFYTSHPDYAWLNRLFCVGVGEYLSAENYATYDVYAVR